jgi:hypothetical protein
VRPFDEAFSQAWLSYMKELFPLPANWKPLSGEELAQFVAELPDDDDDCDCCPCCGCDCADDD